MKKKKILFIANEIEKLLPKVDTTVFLIQQAWVEKYEVWFCTLEDLGINTSGKLLYYANANNIIPSSNYTWFSKKKLVKVSLLSFSAIIVRTDPPFNQQYLLGMNVLDFVTERGIKVINSPESLRKFNEKLYALKFPKHTPATLISSNKKEIIEFLNSKKQVVLKPLNLMGGRGIFLTKIGDNNINVIIDSITNEGKDTIVSQEFLANIKGGDKRIIIINGIVERFALCRKPKKQSIIANLAGGGTASVVKLSKEELEIAKTVAEGIKKDIFFAGLDMIDKKITEINITSPTGMRQIAEYRSSHLGPFFYEQLMKL
ncbi:glutathione synthase [Betaproteobacteria bacterium]|nr:glutathione synthase [Betaproteobacteria bacterium]